MGGGVSFKNLQGTKWKMEMLFTMYKVGKNNFIPTQSIKLLTIGVGRGEEVAKNKNSSPNLFPFGSYIKLNISGTISPFGQIQLNCEILAYM